METIDARFERCVRVNQETWNEWFERDPELAHLERAIAEVGRTLVTTKPSSAIYDQALQEDRKYRDMRREIWEARAKAAAA